MNTSTPNFREQLEIFNEWKKVYHVNNEGDVVFQNKDFMFNVRFTDNSLHYIHKNSRGMENIPKTVIEPDEVWGVWQNVSTQIEVLLNYILVEGKTAYIVQTRKGIIENAFLTKNVNKYRVGVVL